MYRTLTKILVSLALALGLSLVAGTAASQAATTTTATTTSSTNAENPCTTQHNRVHHAKKAVKKAKKALKKAKHTHKAAKIKKAKRHLKKAKRALRKAQKALKRCESSTSGTGGTGGTSGTPSLQSLCDAGVPQTVCDSLATYAGSLSPSSLPLDQFCTSVPQAADLCSALQGGADPSTLTGLIDTLLSTLGLSTSSAPSLQSLCDAGVPQTVCDSLATYAGSLSPSSLPLDQFCTSVPQAADLCTALQGGADPSTLTGLLDTLLTTLGLGNLIGTLPTSSLPTSLPA